MAGQLRNSLLVKNLDLVCALYPYASTADQSPNLAFAQGAVLLVVERSDDGWCRGYCAGVQGWFPASYVQNIPLELLLTQSVDLNQLNSLLRSPKWTVYITAQNQLYYVNNTTKDTSWNMPSLESNTNGTDNQVQRRKVTKEATKSKRPRTHVINGLTFCVDPSEGPELMNPQAPSYIDYFWSDAGEQTGFDVIRGKQINGKHVIKDMIEFLKERAAIEEQYARNLAKLSKSTLGDQEEGTLLRAWQSLKSELRERSEAHAKFATNITDEIEKQLFEFKESQKIDRKQHEQFLEKSRKQVQNLDNAIEKAKVHLSGTKPKGFKRQSSIVSDVKSGDDMMKLELNYNQVQRTWADNMIAACRDFEKQEEERSDFLKNQLFKYVDLCVSVQEANAKAMTYTASMVDNINKKADKEFFIKRKATGTSRPVDRFIEV